MSHGSVAVLAAMLILFAAALLASRRVDWRHGPSRAFGMRRGAGAVLMER